ncbi:TetR/AcrR family transcriptional regulator [Noviherbaspirillum sedimenti]|uniref:TetR/AcrR family transcriptional regulator n=1 Tax=Noviherbaspirillum sedimenti TaxID=2320865 RepID=A0A3A3FXZ1_9BURK|nr:TetR/AcrR family transcriptional regulator [Noviherbaspirillum sedimenti]RJG01063.1 TetR/AcrR family transcriptional regulator [Noviherbaspirillum sedimenti]
MTAQAQPGAKVSGRAQAQCERILCAAQKCFIEHGFHAAGMALIAETAGMSPGLIYRYFPSKSAIILAIVERQLERSRANIRSLHDAPDFKEAAFNAFLLWRDADPCQVNAALFLEMSAEASRDPMIAAGLRTCDQEIRHELAAWLSASVAAGGKGLSAELARVRAITLQTFFEGLSVRALREPDTPLEELKAAIADFVDGLFST